MTQGRAPLTGREEINPESTPSNKTELRNSATTENAVKQPSLLRKSSAGTKRVTRGDIIKNAIIPDFGIGNKAAVVSQEPATMFGTQRNTPAPEMPQKRKTKTRFEYIMGK